MVYRNNKGVQLSTKKVRYLENGAQVEKNIKAEGTQWWVDFAAKWEKTGIIEFVNITHTPEQLERFEEVKNIKIDESILSEYVESGLFPEGVTHPLRDLQIQKETQQLGVSLSEREINETIQGMQISELETQVAAIQGGTV